MSGRRFTMFSGGEGSFRAALIDRANYPSAPYGLVFTDMLYEDADTYRFLIEAAAVVLGYDAPAWLPCADRFPDYRVGEDQPIETYQGNASWRAFLADLRLRTMQYMPEFTWLVEGRDPWEIFRDRRFLGNSLVDPCSRIAKREVADAWRRGHCYPELNLLGDADHFAVGIGLHEKHRFADADGGGLGPRMAAEGWLYHAPLIDAEEAVDAGGRSHLTLLFSPVEQLGVEGQRMYRQGYKHGNCGGFCVKAGQAHWANRFRVQPERYAYDAMMERKLAAFIGKPVSMLTDRRGGKGKKPLTLDSFAARLRAHPERKFEYRPGESGCGCMADA